MIVRLRGTLAEIDQGRVVVDAGGVGYEVLIAQASLPKLPGTDQPITLYTRQVFREDGQFLVGFIDKSERRVFDLLTEVKGCGPKIALQVLSDLGVDTTCAAIASEDTKTLSRATGVGPRLAERIIVELREKVRAESFALRIAASEMPSHASAYLAEDDVVTALVQLGYSRQAASAAADSVDPEVTETPERLRLALQRLKR